ncbi:MULTISPECIES: hypothetical protein [Nocardia]|uniref:hypothetical protein n=1 Tax=Nocardia TaxID=1817 RepID=UPI000AB5458E|nr:MULTISPECIES: hypothetical protein [Nocardia]
MRFVPESVLGMAQTIEPAVEATKAHATNIENVGFDPSHAGQDYGAQGKKIAAGVNGIVTMLQSWSEASEATTGVLRRAVDITVGTDQENRTRIDGSADGATSA